MAVADDVGDWYFNGGRMIPKGSSNISTMVCVVMCVSYVGILRLCIGRLAIISGEVRRSIIIGIGADSLCSLHAELIIERRPPARDIM